MQEKFVFFFQHTFRPELGEKFPVILLFYLAPSSLDLTFGPYLRKLFTFNMADGETQNRSTDPPRDRSSEFPSAPDTMSSFK